MWICIQGQETGDLHSVRPWPVFIWRKRVLWFSGRSIWNFPCVSAWSLETTDICFQDLTTNLGPWGGSPTNFLERVLKNRWLEVSVADKCIGLCKYGAGDARDPRFYALPEFFFQASSDKQCTTTKRDTFTRTCDTCSDIEVTSAVRKDRWDTRQVHSLVETCL